MRKENIWLIYWGQKHQDFNYDDFVLCGKIKRLKAKHQRQCENSCNGYGVVNGEVYYSGSIDDYAKREYGYSVKSAYLETCVDEETVFDHEIDKIQLKIETLLQAQPKYKVEFQHDPRGNTVKLYYNNDYVDLTLF